MAATGASADGKSGAQRFSDMFAAAMAHPLRGRVLAKMAEAPTSPVAIGRELRTSTSTINYHVKTLADYGLIEKVDQRPRRGAMENIYRARVVPILWDEELKELSIEERVEYVETLLSLYGADARAALDSDTLLGRDDWHIARTAMDVDQKGWEDLSTVFADAMTKVAVIKTESEHRIKKQDEPSMRVLAYQSLFELPPRR
jgi:DNA-binding transcriptional ArsR family regulator